jgi:hypothetical protein
MRLRLGRGIRHRASSRTGLAQLDVVARLEGDVGVLDALQTVECQRLDARSARVAAAAIVAVEVLPRRFVLAPFEG